MHALFSSGSGLGQTLAAITSLEHHQQQQQQEEQQQQQQPQHIFLYLAAHCPPGLPILLAPLYLINNTMVHMFSPEHLETLCPGISSKW
jgi:hypothetical protein